MKLIFAAFLLLSRVPGFVPVPGSLHGGEVRHVVVREVVRGAESADDAFLSRPTALAFEGNRLYVADAEECAVKVFTKAGKFVRSMGRKGQGPGEFSFPSGISVRGGRILVADKFNFRIQALDLEGTYLGGFRVPFAPDKVFALGDEVILVTHNPLNRSGSEKMLHAFAADGRLLWEALESRYSGDPVYDTFRNMIAISAGSEGEFFLIFKCDERGILHFDRAGRLVGTITLDERYEDRPLSLPLPTGKRTIRGVGWAWAASPDRFYVLAPAYTSENDLGPGREVFLFGREGGLDGLIRLPDEMILIAVDGDLIFGIDRDRELRILRMSER